MKSLISSNEIAALSSLDLGMDDLEALEAPGWGSWVGGIGVGVLVGGAILYGGIAFT